MIDFSNKYGDISITPRRSAEFTYTANELSEFIERLHLPKEKNDKLVQLMVAHSNAAERGAFLDGFQAGVKLCKSADIP